MHRFVTKTISLSDEAYDALSGVKQAGESFSDVAMRLARAHRQRNIMAFAGAWKGSAKEGEKLKRLIRKWRNEGDRGPVDRS